MPMPISTLKRSQPCLDLISMNPAESQGYPNIDSKKRAAAYPFGWDHYRSDEDLKASYEHQGWRHRKRSRKHDHGPQMISTIRVKVPRHRSISSVLEDQDRPRKMTFRNVPTAVYCSPKPSCGEYQSIYGTSPIGIEEDVSDMPEMLQQIIQDFATLKSLQEWKKKIEKSCRCWFLRSNEITELSMKSSSCQWLGCNCAAFQHTLYKNEHNIKIL